MITNFWLSSTRLYIRILKIFYSFRVGLLSLYFAAPSFGELMRRAVQTYFILLTRFNLKKKFSKSLNVLKFSKDFSILQLTFSSMYVSMTVNDD
jgi:hypothetical protein